MESPCDKCHSQPEQKIEYQKFTDLHKGGFKGVNCTVSLVVTIKFCYGVGAILSVSTNTDR